MDSGKINSSPSAKGPVPSESREIARLRARKKGFVVQVLETEFIFGAGDTGTGVMAKGILKSSQNDSQEEVTRRHSFAGEDNDVPEGNNTTSRIHTLAQRRVSFAPDVTLHSFDFVPEVRDVRLPRRRSGAVAGGAQEEPANRVPGDESVDDRDDRDRQPPEEGVMEITEVFQPSHEMEMTEIFKRHDETMELTEIQRAEDSEPMELTEVQAHEVQAQDVLQRVHTPPPKRRKISDLSEDMELSLMKMSPIGLHSPQKPQERQAPRSLPPPSSSPSPPARRSPSPPLPPPPAPQERYSLRQFLDDAGVTFLIDTTSVETQDPVVFPLRTLSAPQFRTDQVYTPLYVDMPVLEMSAFVCRELLRRIEQSRRQFDDLEQQVSSSPPPLLLKEYFTSGPEMRQLMNQQLQLVKSFAKLEAKKAWYDWRIQHLKGLQNVLTENLALLQDEQAKLDADLQRARRINSRTAELLQSLRREVELVKGLPSQVYKKESRLSDKLRLEQLKQELGAHKIALNDAQQLQRQRQTILSEINSKTRECAQLKTRISFQLSHRKADASEYDMVKLRKKLDMLGVISGVHFRELRGSLLSIECTGFPVLTIDLSLCHSARQQACQVATEDPFYGHFLQYIIAQLPEDTDFLMELMEQLRMSIPSIGQYKLLKLLFPMRIAINQEKIFVELKDYDPHTNTCCFYKFSFEELVKVMLRENSSLSISVHVITNDDVSLAMLSNRFITKTRKILPWANANKIKMLFV